MGQPWMKQTKHSAQSQGLQYNIWTNQRRHTQKPTLVQGAPDKCGLCWQTAAAPDKECPSPAERAKLSSRGVWIQRASANGRPYRKRNCYRAPRQSQFHLGGKRRSSQLMATINCCVQTCSGSTCLAYHKVFLTKTSQTSFTPTIDCD